MIHLRVSKSHPDRTVVEERLQELSLGHSKQLLEVPGVLILQDHQLELSQTKDILSYLDDIAKELDAWYYCGC
ncbi:MAG: hypothetical protein AAF990_02595 [Bacteroidota bacterium]